MGVETQLHSFWTSATYGGKWSAWRSGRFVPGEELRCPKEVGLALKPTWTFWGRGIIFAFTGILTSVRPACKVAISVHIFIAISSTVTNWSGIVSNETGRNLNDWSLIPDTVRPLIHASVALRTSGQPWIQLQLGEWGRLLEFHCWRHNERHNRLERIRWYEYNWISQLTTWVYHNYGEICISCWDGNWKRGVAWRGSSIRQEWVGT
jgi:hypothetical protein